MKTYFTPDFIQFFEELAPNNHKDWFDDNRKRYEQTIKDPFKIFVGDLALFLAKYEPTLVQEPKNLIFRINRDIRFAKDKRPYKTFVSAIISSGGKKDKVMPGMYFELSPEGLFIYGGIFQPGKEQLEDIRYHIANNHAEFRRLVNDKIFQQHFGEILGDKNVRLPKELQGAAEVEPLIYNKQYYFRTKLSSKIILSGNLISVMEEYFLAMSPLNSFFKKALGY
tara:strand:+ start:2394 stop:3065 length:672 start_codon:yes stop_codon:yes gene_type:complete